MAVALCLIDEDLKAGEKTMILRAFDDLMKWNFLLESTSKENILLKLDTETNNVYDILRQISEHLNRQQN